MEQWFWSKSLLLQTATCIKDHEPSIEYITKPDQTKTHRVGVAVAAWPSVLQVSITLLGHLPGDPDAAAPVGDAGGEVVDGGGLVSPGQPSLVVLALTERVMSVLIHSNSGRLTLVGVVGLDVPHMVPGEFVNCRLDRLNKTCCILKLSLLSR